MTILTQALVTQLDEERAAENPLVESILRQERVVLQAGARVPNEYRTFLEPSGNLPGSLLELVWGY